MISSVLQSGMDRVTYPKKVDISATSSIPNILRNTMRGVIMKRIKLTQGKFAIVDEADFEWLNQWNWYLSETKNTCYAFRSFKMAGKWTTVTMHRFILGLKKGNSLESDHKNGKGLDNRRENLRICTHSENMQNRHRMKKGRSCHRQGVYRLESSGRWMASIMKNYKSLYIGTYSTAELAAHAYDKKAVELYGSSAKTNFPKEIPNE